MLEPTRVVKILEDCTIKLPSIARKLKTHGSAVLQKRGAFIR